MKISKRAKLNKINGKKVGTKRSDNIKKASKPMRSGAMPRGAKKFKMMRPAKMSSAIFPIKNGPIRLDANGCEPMRMNASCRFCLRFPAKVSFCGRFFRTTKRPASAGCSRLAGFRLFEDFSFLFRTFEILIKELRQYLFCRNCL